MKKGITKKENIKYNYHIKHETIMVIDENDKCLGVMNIKDALKEAKLRELDLIEVNPNTDPPVCKIFELGKYKYLKNKLDSEKLKKQKQASQLKRIKIGINIDQHDLLIKMKSIKEFLNHGDKVQITITYRFREIVNQQDLPQEFANSILNMLDDNSFIMISKINQEKKKTDFTIQGVRSKCAKNPSSEISEE